METSYWTLFWVSLICGIGIFVFIVLVFVFIKKVFLNKKFGVVLFIFSLLVLLFFETSSTVLFVRCCNDYSYVSNHTYEEERAKVIEYTYIENDPDYRDKKYYLKPKFYLIDKDEYIILYTKNVIIGETYLIRYYPNTKLCNVIEKLS